jgi:hypothetical protein
VPGRVLGRDGSLPASEKIVMAGLGIGGRGSGVLGEFLGQPDVQCVAVCDARADRRDRVKKMVDDRYGNQDCVMYRDFRDLFARDDLDAVLITTGSNNHGLLSIYAARAGKDVYCEKPCTKTIAESLGAGRDVPPHRPRLPGRHAAAECVELRPGRRPGAQRAAGQAPRRPRPPRRHGNTNQRLARPEPAPSVEEVDWDLFLGTAAWRPFSRAC